MFAHASAPDVLVENPSSSAEPYRVQSIAINETTFKTIAQTDYAAVLWGALDRCVVPAEQRFHAHFGRNKDDILAALAKIKVTFPSNASVNGSILGPLTTDYPALVRSLLVLTIGFNNYDESAVLGAFAALAPHLQELSFWCCGLTSVQGLEGRCQYLRKVDLYGCQQLTNIDALSDRVYLEEVDVSATATTSIEPLRSCPNLAKVNIYNCLQVSSIDALGYHQYLEEVNVAHTAITIIEPLCSCPKLTKVNLFGCRQVSSVQALAGHRWLQEVVASGTAITSIEPLRSCPALTKVVISGCENLRDHVNVCLPVIVNVIQK